MLSDTKSPVQQFRAALAADADPLGPDDPTPGGVALPRPTLIQTVGAGFPTARGFTGYAVRLAVVDGEEEVETGAVLTQRVGRPELARDLAEEADLGPLPWATHLVVNDHAGTEHYRRALRAA